MIQLQIETIDAAGKSFGRLASEVALLLQGKREVTYAPNVAPKKRVAVKNLSQVKFTGRKKDAHITYRYTGYPGGLRRRTLGDRWEKDPVRVFEETVAHMLPKNKLRRAMLKHLDVTL